MIGIGKGQGQWVEEDRRRLFKGYTVLLKAKHTQTTREMVFMTIWYYEL